MPQPWEDFCAPRWRRAAGATDGDCPSAARVPERTFHQSWEGASDQELDLAPQLISDAQGTEHHSQDPSWVQSVPYLVLALQASL